MRFPQPPGLFLFLLIAASMVATIVATESTAAGLAVFFGLAALWVIAVDSRRS